LSSQKRRQHKLWLARSASILQQAQSRLQSPQQVMPEPEAASFWSDERYALLFF
jgi:hypothetical protein